jgi:hypothetical protein
MTRERHTDKCILRPGIPSFAAQVNSGYEMILAIGFPAMGPKSSRGKNYSPTMRMSQEVMAGFRHHSIGQQKGDSEVDVEEKLL